jgi:hypothetical protein
MHGFGEAGHTKTERQEISDRGSLRESEDEGEERARRQRRPIASCLLLLEPLWLPRIIVIGVALSALLILVMRGCTGTWFDSDARCQAKPQRLRRQSRVFTFRTRTA